MGSFGVNDDVMYFYLVGTIISLNLLILFIVLDLRKILRSWFICCF